MINRTSEEIKQMLLQAGWFPGRDVSSEVDEWELQLEVHGYITFPAAREVLIEMGGLLIGQQPPPHSESGLLPFKFDPLAVLVGDAPWIAKEIFDTLAEQAGVRVYPIGEFLDSHYLAAISEDGMVFAALDYATMIGPDLEQALENIRIGRQLHEMDFPL